MIPLSALHARQGIGKAKKMEKHNPEWVERILSELKEKKESKTPSIDTDANNSNS